MDEPLDRPLAKPSFNVAAARKHAGSIWAGVDPEDGDGSLLYALGSPEEEACVAELETKIAQDEQCQQLKPFWRLACLRARKYDIERAIELIQNYAAWRQRFRVEDESVEKDPKLMAFVERGVQCTHGNYDKDGRYRCNTNTLFHLRSDGLRVGMC
jgi:hypothetical protein